MPDDGWTGSSRSTGRTASHSESPVRTEQSPNKTDSCVKVEPRSPVVVLCITSDELLTWCRATGEFQLWTRTATLRNLPEWWVQSLSSSLTTFTSNSRNEPKG